MTNKETPGISSSPQVAGYILMAVIGALVVISYVLSVTVALWMVSAAAFTLTLVSLVAVLAPGTQDLFARLFGYTPAPAPVQLSPAEIIRGGLGALLVTISILELRALNGLMSINPYTDWDLSAVPDFWLLGRGSALVPIYPKLHIRIYLIQGGVYFVLAGVLLILIAQFWRRTNFLLKVGGWVKNTHLVLLLILYFAVTVRPPFSLVLDHWASWVAPAVQMRAGIWPIFHSVYTYGILSPAIIWLLLEMFPATPLLFYILSSAVLILSLLFMYHLTQQITHSEWLAVGMVALLGLVFNDAEYALLYPNIGALRYGFLISSHLLLAWVALGEDERQARWACFGLGVMAYWDPLTAVFALIGLVGALVYKAWRARSTAPLIRIGALVGSGLMVLLLIPIIAGNFRIGTFQDILYRAVGFASLFSTAGFGGYEQSLVWNVLLVVLVMMMGLVMVGARVVQGETLEREDLFIGVNLVFLIPILLYYTARTSFIGSHAMMWMTLPSSLLVIKRLSKFTPKPGQHAYAGAIWLVIIALSGSALTGSTYRVSRVLLSYESVRFEWARACAEYVARDEPCPAGDWPGGISAGMPQVTAPIIPNEELILAEACQDGLPIWSVNDAFIYEYGDCQSQTSFGSIVYVFDSENLSHLVDQYATYDTFLMSSLNTEVEHLDRLRGYYEAQFRQRGLCPQFLSETVVQWGHDCGVSFDVPPDYASLNSVLRFVADLAYPETLVLYGPGVSLPQFDDLARYGLTFRPYTSFAEGTQLDDLIGSYLLIDTANADEIDSRYPDLRLSMVAQDNVTLYQITGMRGDDVLTYIYDAFMPQPTAIDSDLAGAAAQLPAGSTVLVYPEPYAEAVQAHVAEAVSVYAYPSDEWPISDAQAEAYIAAVTDDASGDYYLIEVEQGQSDPVNDLTLAALAESHFVGRQYFGPVILSHFVQADTLETAGVNAEFSIGVTLESVQSPAEAEGREVPITVTWQRTNAGAINPELKVFVHLLDGSGQVVTQVDGLPLAGLRPFNAFEVGTMTEDRFVITLPEGIAPGPYELRLGIYDPADGSRVSAEMPDATSSDYLLVGVVQVGE